MIARSDLTKLRRGFQRRADRRMRWIYQRLCFPDNIDSRLVFIFGCQRSGTTILLRLLAQSVHTVFYSESDPPLMKNLRLAEPEVVKKVLASTAAPVVMCKPICDSQWADRLLETYETARALWIYRHYDDVVNSSLRRFTGQRARAEKLVEGRHRELGWRAERVHPEDLATVRELFSGTTTRADAAALIWYLRNCLFYRQELENDRRLRLVKYEHLVKGGTEYVRSLFEFAGIPFNPSYIARLNASSVGKHPPPELTSNVRQLCQAMQDKLDETHAAASPAG